MSTPYIVFNFISAFLIGTGTALGVAFVGGKPTPWQIAAAVTAGLIAASKDTRSLLKLPPVSNGTGNTETITKP